MSDPRLGSIPVGILVSVSDSRPRRRRVKPPLRDPSPFVPSSLGVSPSLQETPPLEVTPPPEPQPRLEVYPAIQKDDVRPVWPAVAALLTLAVIGGLFLVNARRVAPPAARIAKAPPPQVRASEDAVLLAAQRPAAAGAQEGAPQLGLAGADLDIDAGARPLAAKSSNLGTDIAFGDDPPAAFRAATRERKLVMMVHLSGNFEDKEFT
jgi:hypothetical protein